MIFRWNFCVIIPSFTPLYDCGVRVLFCFAFFSVSREFARFHVSLDEFLTVVLPHTLSTKQQKLHDNPVKIWSYIVTINSTWLCLVFSSFFCIVRNSNLEFIKTKNILYMLLCVHFSQPEKKYYVNKETKIFVGKKPIEWNNNNNGMIHI